MGVRVSPWAPSPTSLCHLSSLAKDSNGAVSTVLRAAQRSAHEARAQLESPPGHHLSTNLHLHLLPSVAPDYDRKVITVLHEIRSLGQRPRGPFAVDHPACGKGTEQVEPVAPKSENGKAPDTGPGRTHGRFPERRFLPAASRTPPPACAGPGYGSSIPVLPLPASRLLILILVPRRGLEPPRRKDTRT